MMVNDPEGSVPRVFVSYRREDSAASAGRLGDRLMHEFGKDHVFMDVDSIPLGSDFVKRLAEEVQRCDVLLAVIGPEWTEIRDEDGNRRLDDPNDFVRLEIREALQRDIPVVPVLLEGTKIPKASSLPEDIKSLTLRNALHLRHGSFQIDLDRLVQQLKVRGSAFPFKSMFGSLTSARLALILLLGSCLIALSVVLSRQLTKLPAIGVHIPISETSTAGSVDRDFVVSDSQKLFQDMILDRNRLASLNQQVDQVVLSRGRYEDVQSATGVPWFIIGIVHLLDTSGNFSVHLNGDPLTARTINVPRGRPLTGDPPFSWKDSAIDLVKISFPPTPDFSTVGSILYALERYNGFGYRRRNFRSPFIWGCTNQYVSGKFVADNTFDPNSVSAQCGAAAMLKVMLDKNVIKI
jgi:lysozyme family protein